MKHYRHGRTVVEFGDEGDIVAIPFGVGAPEYRGVHRNCTCPPATTSYFGHIHHQYEDFVLPVRHVPGCPTHGDGTDEIAS